MGLISILGFIGLEKVQSAAACLPSAGLVFQTGFVYGRFRATSYLCGQQRALQLKAGTASDPNHHVSLSTV